MRPHLSAFLICLGLAGCVVEPPDLPPAIPPPRVEAVPPPPTPRVVWQPGGWHFSGGSYVWVPGHYVKRLAAYHRWIPGHWDPGRVWVAGHWV